jgi:hypothetical protein
MLFKIKIRTLLGVFLGVYLLGELFDDFYYDFNYKFVFDFIYIFVEFYLLYYLLTNGYIVLAGVLTLDYLLAVLMFAPMLAFFCGVSLVAFN